ncbi:hypothetical protein B0I35DRAFT_436594 [Stachybotrys elegans]|uniref:Uncharacterized protein n=1 Tax=Stachybotrys elegans TaxID=80388 RepID=A0A8K0WPK1_9HYPO|nr:hypothetical protein B0I35DRAFT_436594 [Stachybotrys elegans]
MTFETFTEFEVAISENGECFDKCVAKMRITGVLLAKKWLDWGGRVDLERKTKRIEDKYNETGGEFCLPATTLVAAYAVKALRRVSGGREDIATARLIRFCQFDRINTVIVAWSTTRESIFEIQGVPADKATSTTHSSTSQALLQRLPKAVC